MTTDDEAAPAVYTVDEAAKLLRIGRSACYAAVKRGEIPAVRLGRSLRIPAHALERLLSAATPPKGSAAETASQPRPLPHDRGR